MLKTAIPADDIFTGKTALLVEDQFLIAIDAEEWLHGMGFSKVVTSPSVSDALKVLQSFLPDVAILDVNLGAGTSAPIAEELQRQSIPFIFATGYGDLAAVPDHLKTAGMVHKPYSMEALRTQLSQALGVTK